MTRPRSISALALTAVFLTACATSGGTQQAVPATAAPPEKTTGAKTSQPASPPKEKAAALAPSSPLTADHMYKILVAEVAMQRGQYDLAIENYTGLARQTRDAALAERAARVAVYTHDDEKALAAAKLWLELAPGDTEARQVLTAFHIRLGHLDEARKQIEAVLTDSSKEEEDKFALIAGLLGRQQDKQAALTIMEQVLAQHPKDTTALYAYSQLAIRAGELDKAEDAVRRMIQREPGQVELNVQLARILTMRGKVPEALEFLDGALAKHPKDINLRTAYGRLLLDNKQYEKALEQYRLIVAQNPADNEAAFTLGVLALELEQVDEGEAVMRKLNARGAYLSDTSYFLGRVAEIRKDSKQAISWYLKVENGDNYLDANIRVAAIMAEQGDLVLARSHLHNIEARGPAQIERIYLAEGEILRQAGRHAEAAEVLTAALKELPDNTELLYSRAMSYEKTNQIDLMEADLKSILSREPDNAEALNSLGYTLADRTTRYDEALQYVKRALELRPQSHYVLDSMGWVEYRLGHYDEAAKHLRKAMEINQDPEIAAHLTEVLWVMGKKQEARAVWKQGLDLSPDNPLLIDVMKRLDK